MCARVMMDGLLDYKMYDVICFFSRKLNFLVFILFILGMMTNMFSGICKMSC